MNPAPLQPGRRLPAFWRRSHSWILLIGCSAILAVFCLPPIPQDPGYHRFADTRSWLGIPNFWNVASNLPFVAAGLWGAMLSVRWWRHPAARSARQAAALFSLGVFSTGFGSAYYHWAPANDSLLWDRLPMTIAFMAFFSGILSETAAPKGGRRLLWPLLALGAGSVIYWDWTEGKGAGDLRPYALVQFLPLLLVPLLLFLHRPAHAGVRWYWAVLVAYGASKLAEWQDAGLLHALGMSGHAIKHLLAAAGAACYLEGLRRRFREPSATR